MTMLIASLARKLAARTSGALRRAFDCSGTSSRCYQARKMNGLKPSSALLFERLTAFRTVPRSRRFVNRKRKSALHQHVQRIWAHVWLAIEWVNLATRVIAVALTTTPSGMTLQVNARRIALGAVVLFTGPDWSIVSLCFLLLDTVEVTRAARQCFDIILFELTRRI